MLITCPSCSRSKQGPPPYIKSCLWITPQVHVFIIPRRQQSLVPTVALVAGRAGPRCSTSLDDTLHNRLSNMSSYGNGHGPSRYQEAALNRSYSGCDQCHHDRKKVGLYTRIPNTRKFICVCPSVKAASLVLAVQERRRIVPLAISVKSW